MTLARTIKLLIGAVVLFNLLLWVPSTRLFCLYALGRSSRCTMRQTVHSFDLLARRVAIQKELDRGKHLIQIPPVSISGKRLSAGSGFPAEITRLCRSILPNR